MKLFKLTIIVLFLVASVTCRVVTTMKPDGGGVQYCNICCDEKGNCWITSCW